MRLPRSWGGRGTDWEFGMNRCKLWYIDRINSKVLLYITGDYIQYPVINHNGKEYEKECIYMYNWITLLYTWNNIVNQLSSNIKQKVKKKTCSVHNVIRCCVFLRKYVKKVQIKIALSLPIFFCLKNTLYFPFSLLYNVWKKNFKKA